MAYFGALEISGSRIRGRIYDEGGHRLGSEVRQIFGSSPGQQLAEWCIAVIKDAMESANVSPLEGIAASVVGSCDAKNSAAVSSLSYGADIHLKRVGQYFNTPFDLVSCGNAAARGVLQLDQQIAGMNNIIYIAMDRNIGGGIILDRRVYEGNQGIAGQIGHMKLNPEGSPCECSQRGCWQTYSSGAAVEQRAAELLARTNPKGYLRQFTAIRFDNVFAGAREGDVLCQEVVERASKYNLVAIANLVHLFNPDALIFGEAMLVHERQILGPIRERLGEILMNGYAKPRILRTTLELPVIEGAAHIAIDKYHSSRPI